MSFWTHCAGIIRHDWLPDVCFEEGFNELQQRAEELKERIRIIEILDKNLPKGSEEDMYFEVHSPYLITIQGDLRDVGENKEAEWKEIEDWFRNACEEIGDIRQGILEISNLYNETKVVQYKKPGMYGEDEN